MKMNHSPHVHNLILIMNNHNVSVLNTLRFEAAWRTCFKITILSEMERNQLKIKYKRKYMNTFEYLLPHHNGSPQSPNFLAHNNIYPFWYNFRLPNLTIINLNSLKKWLITVFFCLRYVLFVSDSPSRLSTLLAVDISFAIYWL